MKRFLLIPLAIIILAGLFIPACGPSGPVVGTTIRVAVGDFANESTDPINLESLWGWMMYEALLRWDEAGNIIPGVADSWTFDASTSTYTFKIHEGITFWNGEALTAEDVKFSMDRFSDMSQSSNPWSYYLSTLYNQVETRVVDDYTFQFVQDHPEPSQLVIMAWVRILPKDYYESVGMDEFRAHPIGSGPWKFVELVPETTFKLEANTEYWRTDEIPAFQYYLEYQVPEQATRIAMLKTGDVDIAFVDYDRIQDLVDEGFTALDVGVPGTTSLCIQGAWLPDAGPVGDIRVRQALSFALDRQEICDTWFSGFAEPGGQFYMYPGGYGWSDDLAADPYDPEKAEALLAEANYPDAFDDPVIHCYTTAAGGLSGGPDFFLLLMDYWEDVGLQVELEVLDATIWNNYMFSFTRLQGGEENVGWIFNWNYQAFFNSTYQCANMYTSVGVHNSGDNGATADELYAKAANETDPELAAQYYNEFQIYARSLYTNIGVAQVDQMLVYDPDTIGGFEGRTWVSYWDSTYGIQQP